jgi:hypothetical protein
MKMLMVANMREAGRYSIEKLVPLLKAQIENSLALGWKPKRIWLLTNFPFSYMRVKGTQAELTETCLTGSKMFGLKWLFDNGHMTCPIWAHDLDVWQNEWFDLPEFADVGICRYSNSKLNGGSAFWKPEARDIVDEIIQRIADDGEMREEPTLNRVLKNSVLKKRVTVLNETYNVGCSGFVKRAERAEKPILAAHFHPLNRIAWETHALDRNEAGIKSVSDRLESLLREHWPRLATKVITKKGHRDATGKAT